MAEFFEMPQASPTMEAGTILAWRKQEGDELAPQDVIAEVETDKAAMEIEVFDKGFLLKILVEEGDEVPAGVPIAIIGTSADEDISDLMAKVESGEAGGSSGSSGSSGETAAATARDDGPAPAKAAEPTAAASPAKAPAIEAGLTPFTWKGQAVHDSIMELPAAFEVGGAEGEVPLASGKVRAAPAARAAAREHRVDLATVSGTGPRGRITRQDVEQAARGGARRPAAAEARPEPTEVKVTGMRKTIARRLTEAYLGAPVFFLTANWDVGSLVTFRGQLKEAGVKVSYNDLVLKAAARALRDVPAVNASWGGDVIHQHGRVDIGVAVALEGGLITPVVRDADRKGVATIAEEVRDLAGRARDRKLKPEEYQGGTFTISNLGMFGIEHFTAIINPPEACILAVGALQQEPVVVDGALSVGWRMRVTLTCDHRVVDGALGAQFLQAVQRYIEHPALLAA